MIADARRMTPRACSLASLAMAAGCSAPAAPNPVVGTWVVQHASAPFQHHMYVFHADGTMQQANPEAGNARESDGDGIGIWVAAGDSIRGKFVEMRADRATHAYIGRGEIAFTFAVQGDSLSGAATGRFLDSTGVLEGSVSTDMRGSRVTLR